MKRQPMHRRSFLTLLGGAAAAWPAVARGQQVVTRRVIGLVGPLSPEQMQLELSSLMKGLGDTGYREGQNVKFEYRWAQGAYDRMPDLVTDPIQYSSIMLMSSWRAYISISCTRAPI